MPLDRALYDTGFGGQLLERPPRFDLQVAQLVVNGRDIGALGSTEDLLKPEPPGLRAQLGQKLRSNNRVLLQ